TMGGICFIFAMLIVSIGALLLNREEAVPFVLAMGLGLMNALIGFVDDYTKLIKKQNEGLLAWQKFSLQLVAAALYLVAMTLWGGMTTVLAFPFTDFSIDLGVVYYVVALILITGVVNSVNLTDGIDGLASSVTLVVGAFFAVCAFSFGMRSLSLISALLIGGMLGFLVYNFHPARVFMGDTGSLFLGGVVIGAAFALGEPLIALICGLVYMIETLSVMLQVSVFKLSGRKKRLFKMAPIHHHFEKCGWGEIKIVCVFSAVTLLLCVVAWFGVS
ncbi:MAG: phospho-N-acetylmuramoyl-pentapeptide-transferase, partial [Clostridia bacterium]|nr:phospho-N-acetylmuramoyl-pentapeptide-transferase [Clostridia bacterium]